MVPKTVEMWNSKDTANTSFNMSNQHNTKLSCLVLSCVLVSIATELYFAHEWKWKYNNVQCTCLQEMMLKTEVMRVTWHVLGRRPWT